MHAVGWGCRENGKRVHTAHALHAGYGLLCLLCFNNITISLGKFMSTQQTKQSKRPHSDLNGIIKTLSEIKDEIKDDELLLYRGQSSIQWDLVPSIKRDGLDGKENVFIKELISSYPNEFSDTNTTFEQLIKAQHYELPTRLIDLTFNPLVALYFSLNSVEEKQKNNEIVHNKDGKPKMADGCIFIFKVKKSTLKYYDSDTVSCLANLAFLTQGEREKIKELCRNFVRDEPDDIQKRQTAINEFHSNSSVKRLLHFIKMEKNHFDDNINPKDLLSNYIVKGKMNNRRILAQQGAFLLCGLNSLEEQKDIVPIQKLKMSAASKDNLKTELDKLMSINDATIFPEIINHAHYIKKFM